jgi:hypothetical protein
MSLVQVPFNAPKYMALSTDMTSGSTLPGMAYCGAFVYFTDTQKWYTSGSDLVLTEYTGTV